MRQRSRDSLPGIFSPVLTAPILERIHALNRDYVELLIADCSAQSSAELAAPTIAGLAALSPAARQALASCPFALYSLNLEHSGYWRAGADTEPAVDQRYRARASASSQNCFNTSAMFFAWHVANSQRLAAKVFYAMPDVVIDGFARMQLWQLHDVAYDSVGLLKPRWPTNHCFWPDLLRFAAAGDMSRLATAQLLGSQLIAAELRGNTAYRGVLRPAAAQLTCRSGTPPG